jgi:hypothetical protein
MDCVNHPGVDAPYHCSRCRAPICVDCESKLSGASICRSCLGQIRERITSRYQAEQYQVNYCGAFLAALAAAVAVGLAWSQLVVWTAYRPQFAAALLGGAVGYATHVGAGHKRGRSLQQLAAVIALFGIILGHYFVFWRTEFTASLAVATGSPLLAFPGYLSTNLDFLDWLFLAVGVAWSYWTPHVRTLPG